MSQLPATAWRNEPTFDTTDAIHRNRNRVWRSGATDDVIDPKLATDEERLAAVTAGTHRRWSKHLGPGQAIAFVDAIVTEKAVIAASRPARAVQGVSSSR
jgi:hypothetical protein